MMRWVLVAVSLQLACLQTEPIDLASDGADVAQEIAETNAPAETEVDTSPEPATNSPCITVTPSRVVFGGRPLGAVSTIEVTVLSCGAVPLTVTDLALSGSGDFSVLGVTPTTLAPSASMTVSVSFMPSEVAIIGADDNPIRELGELTIVSTASTPVVVPIEGFGTDDDCPSAVIRVAEGDEVIPQTLLHLDGSSSTAPGATIVGYEWTVLQPGGSVSTFIPSASVVAPTFEANIYGSYTFRLSVIDALGNRSCAPAEYTVVVLDPQAIHVELIWDTPGDPNQTDSSDGSDIDLHFLSPKANGELFGTYDCHWDNRRPDWGAPGTDEDPSLDRDDSDGAGPENLSVDGPEQGARYQVTAHYFEDAGYGDSVVTVRVYIRGTLRDEWSTSLTKNDQWDVFYIDWPSGAVTRIGGGVPQIKQTTYEQ